MTDVTTDNGQAPVELSAADEQVLRELTDRARAGGLRLTSDAMATTATTIAIAAMVLLDLNGLDCRALIGTSYRRRWQLRFRGRQFAHRAHGSSTHRVREFSLGDLRRRRPGGATPEWGRNRGTGRGTPSIGGAKSATPCSVPCCHPSARPPWCSRS